MLTIIGLGPGDPDFLTLKAYRLLTSGKKIYLRTRKHPVVDFLENEGAVFASYDDTYESASDFDSVYATIAADLIERLDEGDVIYAVPGNPFVAEKSVALAIAMAKEKEMPVEVLYGASFIDAIVTATGEDPVEGLSILDAFTIEDRQIIPEQNHLIIQVYDDRIASRVKLSLMDYYDDDHPVLIIRGAGIRGEERIERVPLYELDRRGELIDHLTSLYVPAAPEKKREGFFDLVRVMRRLRGPGGCPWDMEQTHESLTPYLIEETYEVLDAIEKEDPDELSEELGDLLLQVVFHATIAAEDGYFDIHDVTDGITRKLIHRHPHVFDDLRVAGSEEVLENWETIKKKEKEEDHLHEAMARIPTGMPALMRAYKIQKKAAGVGFDWPEIGGVIEKVHEELGECARAEGEEERMEEVGDLLFSVVNLARHYGVRPELALKRATEKFLQRFTRMEEVAHEAGEDLGALSADEMEILWEKSKKSHDLAVQTQKKA